MSTPFPTRIVVPSRAKAGEIVEIKTLIRHVMETGHRRDNLGRAIPRDIIKWLTVTYDGAVIFRAEMFPGTAANPFLAFTTIATQTGDIVFTWTAETGTTTVERRRIEVV